MTSRWFHVSEFACHDGTPYPEAWLDRLDALCSQLDIVRGKWGGPLRVVSGYRTLAHNVQVGGASASQHVDGRAADIAPMVAGSMMGACVADLHSRIMRALGVGELPLIGGVGYYPAKWVHLDIRARPASGHIARWEGAGIGDERAA